MTIKRVFEEARSLLERAGYPGARVGLPKSSEFGEAYSPLPLEIASKCGENPLKLAESIKSKIGHSELIESIEVASPGYLNFRVNWRRFASLTINEVLRLGRQYGFTNIGKGDRVLIEHTSVNPNKALHIGHARNVCIGDLLARLYSKVGYNVAVLNYIDDSGAQMAELLLGFMELGYSEEAPPGMRFDEYCGDIVYVEVNKKAETDPIIDVKRRELARQIEIRGSEAFRKARIIADKVLKEQLKTCARLGARYDLLCRESDVITFNLWDEAFRRLKESGAIYLAEKGAEKGCWCIDLSGHEVLSKEGDEILVKSDGGTTYVARDIGFAIWKLGESSADFRYSSWGKNLDGTDILITDLTGDRTFDRGRPKLVITVIDSRQKRPQSVIKYALSKIGIDPSRYIHFSYEPVTLSSRSAKMLGMATEAKQVHMSGRRGIYFKVDEVLDRLKELAVSETIKRHPDWDREKLEKVSEAIAIASLRYSILKADTDKSVIFDLEESTKIEGDTGPYILYSVARAFRILEKASDAGITKNPEAPERLEQSEKELVRAISHLPLIVEETLETMLIKKLITHSRLLATRFNEFYENCPVIGSGVLAGFRLALVESYILSQSGLLEVIGLPILVEM
ncbi:MAG: arginine--tRNA ligase [Nitrososphaerota archaeon]